MKTKKERELLLTESYNVILDERTSEKERKLLLAFNHSVESGKDFEVACRELKSALERLALRQLAQKEKLSVGVSQLYHKLSSSSLRENLEKGFAMSAMYIRDWY